MTIQYVVPIVHVEIYMVMIPTKPPKPINLNSLLFTNHILTHLQGDEKLDESKRVKMEFSAGEATLEISPSEPSDSNEYKVEAKNKMGEVSSNATLTVHG